MFEEKRRENRQHKTGKERKKTKKETLGRSSQERKCLLVKMRRELLPIKHMIDLEEAILLEIFGEWS